MKKYASALARIFLEKTHRRLYLALFTPLFGYMSLGP